MEVRKHFIFPIVACSLMFFAASEIYACSCIEGVGQTIKTRVRNQKQSATAVFAGEVVEVRLSEKDEKGDSPILYAKIKVERVWKGVKTNIVEVATANFCCVCGFPLKMGQRYLVFATELPIGGLATHMCAGNRFYDRELPELKYLGPSIFVNSSIVTTK